MDYLTVDAARRYARTMADEAGLSVKFHDRAGMFWTEGKCINVPDPAIDANEDIWFYGLVHEIQHHDPRYRKFMYDAGDKHRHGLNNILADYQHESGLYGRYAGKDRIMVVGRAAFLRNLNPSKEHTYQNDYEKLFYSLFCHLDQRRADQWSGFVPSLTNDPALLTQSEDIRQKFGQRILDSVNHSLDAHKQLIEDLIHEYVKDQSCPPTPQEGQQGEQQCEAEAKQGNPEAQKKLKQLQKMMQKLQASSPDSHEDVKDKGKETADVMNHRAQVRDWNYKDQLTELQIPNISESVRKLLLAKKQKTYESNKHKGKFRGQGISNLLRHDLRVFSQKQEALDISTDVIVLVDISGSMSGREIIDATNATAGFAQVLQDLQAKYGILAFSSNLHWVKRLNARYSTSEILQKISTLQVEGSTMMHQAILEASYSLSGSKNKAIILITDGSPSDYLQGKNDVPALLKVCEKHGIKSYTILIQMQYHLKAFQDAKLPAVNVNSTEELPAAMMNIVQELYS